MQPTRHPSPNFGARRGGVCPSLIVLHYTAMSSTAAALARLCDPAFEVSSHYLISERGEVLALVDEAMRAWHAGAGAWAGITDVNSHSIGIELANDGAQPFAHPQMCALEALLAGLMTRWLIAPERVIGHSDMAPGRKFDPGPRFDWHRLARAGLAVWPDHAPVSGDDPAGFRDFAGALGYSLNVADAALLQAFRLRFRPWATGPLDGGDMQRVQSLARFHVDLPRTSA